ncbi:glycosyltransferase family 4 protein [Thermophilibacter immobilis]|uniref:Glycosyltransferase family 4 protein n=1 Tax=Thermophilibacter immobilis TaxID=2779519 RepID=A0A7S7M7M2_9ACTN|nr:glycosyltransferase family 4 protein [Thermophilibacter immobilis]QOY60222.1 glycosyltransferase family 4 protein [Thermophilibacter immobilis]
MRILSVSAQKPDGTGSGTFLAQTVAAQVAAGHETAVICGVSNSDAIESLPAQTRVFSVRFDTSELPFHVCGMSDEMPYPATRYCDLTPAMEAALERAFGAALDRALLEFEPDLVICHHLYLVSSFVRERVRGVPVGVLCHATDLRQMALHGLEHERIVRAMRRMDAVFALHETQAAQVVKTYGVDWARVHMMGTGYDHRIFCPGDGRVPRRPGSLAFVGKMSFKKGVESLIAALDLIGPEDVGLEGLSLTLVGGHDPASSDYARIERRARACRWPVRLAGRVPEEEVVRAYRASEVFVLPSFYEGMPLVGIEALACGCKVVMTDLPGLCQGMEALLPRNPLRWVAPPTLVGVDTPDPAELPSFERRLADAILDALRAPSEPFDTSAASWAAVSARILSHLKPGSTPESGALR